MRNCLIVGQPNVGKTWTSLRLTEASGAQVAHIVQELPGGEVREHTYRIHEAVARFVGAAEHTTLGVQTMGLAAAAIGGRTVLLSDSTGLRPQSVEDRLIRQGMAKTLILLTSCTCILHVVDLSEIEEERDTLSEMDRLIQDLAMARDAPYLLLFNKADLRGARKRGARLQKRMRQLETHLISAKTGEGFGAVLRAVRKASVVH